MGLLPKNASVRGSIRLSGLEIVGLDERGLRSIRGRVVSMIFQEPMTALNPVYTVGFQIAEMLRSHQSMSPRRPGGGRSNCSIWSRSRSRSDVSTPTRTSCRAGSASGR